MSRPTGASSAKAASCSRPTIPAARTCRPASRKFPIYTTTGGTLGVTQRFNRLDFTLKGSIDRTVYQLSFLQDGTTSSNDDRDFYQYGGQLRDQLRSHSRREAVLRSRLG